MNNPKHIHLWGNHDLPYAFLYNPLADCPGFTRAKLKNVQEVMNHADWRKLKFFYIREGWLLSHAGLSAKFLPRAWNSKDITNANIKRFLTSESEHALTGLTTLHGHWIYFHRAGMLWCRPDEFSPIAGVSQIFGHTFHEYPSLTRGDTGLDSRNSIEVLKETYSPKDRWNVDLDCANKYYGILNDGILTLKSK